MIGARLVPLLVGAGHEVAGMTRTPAKANALHELGAHSVVCDVYDLDALREAMSAFGPDLVMSQLTDMPDERARVREFAEANRRMYREGTPNVVAAALDAGAGRLAAQSVAWEPGGATGEAVNEHERAVLDQGGLVIRYGRFYGPGTYFDQELPGPPRIHVDEAARRTVAAMRRNGGIVALTEDVPLERP